MAKEILRVEGLRKWYPLKRSLIESINRAEVKNVKAVDDVSFTLNEGEILGVIGESGCGKSTLGRNIVGLEVPTAGEIFFQNESGVDLLKTENKRFRSMAQIVFQNPFETLNPRHTILYFLARPLEIHGIGADADERYAICHKALEDAGLSPAENFLMRHPHELSGGQLQRISVLRAMLLNPLFIVADEPVSMLDVSVRAEILNTLLELIRKNNTAMIFISHDIAVTRYVSQRIAVMYLGRFVEVGDADDVIGNPQHPYTKVLLSNCPTVDPFDQREGIFIEGEPPTPVNPGPGCYFAERCYAAYDRCFKEYPNKTDLGNGHTVYCHLASKEQED